MTGNGRFAAKANMSDTPIVFLIFNRPDLTARVFAAIREARPRTLLIVSDGPRSTHPDDAAKVAATRAIVEKVDWPCTVLKDYAADNLGCMVRVSSGLTWAFKQVEEAIILEDDCLPHPSFFRYCSNLLERYRDDARVMHIGANNFQNGIRRTPHSYYFSKISHIWGWATWRRAWQLYDVNLQGLAEFLDSNGLTPYCPNLVEREYWIKIFQDTAARQHTWDSQWVYALWKQSALAVVPEVNLISNIGFGPEATHTLGNAPEANLAVADIGEISHPPFIVRCVEADDFTFNNVYARKRKVHPVKALLRRIKKIVRNAFPQVS